MFLLLIQSFSPVNGLIEAKIDPENDVYYFHNQNVQQGDFHDEIDIVSLEINGQNLNLSLAGNINGWVNNDTVDYIAHILLVENFEIDSYKQGELPYPYYIIRYVSLPYYYSGFKVLLYKMIGFLDFLFWTGSGWSTNPDLAQEIGSISANSIIANVPIGAYTIAEDITFFAIIEHMIFGSDTIYYMDIIPNEYSLWSVSVPESILSYNIFILTGLLFGISIIIIKNMMKEKEIRNRS
ncbi:MAG: hypothetical protein ACFE9N_00410 [Promethearchaeota archaeon]